MMKSVIAMTNDFIIPYSLFIIKKIPCYTQGISKWFFQEKF